MEDPGVQAVMAAIHRYREEGLSLRRMCAIMQEEGFSLRLILEIMDEAWTSPRIRTAGRTDCADYFERSGIRSSTDLPHTPIHVFLPQRASIEVSLVRRPAALLALDDAVCCMGQWPGAYRSDWFQFTIGQLKAHLAEHPKDHYQVM